MDLNKTLNNLEFPPGEQNWVEIESKTRQKEDGVYDMKITPPEICWIKIAEQIGNSEKEISNSQRKANSDYFKWIRYAAIFIGIILGTIGLLNNSVRNKLLNSVLESNLKTSLSDTQYILPANKKKSDTIIKKSINKLKLPLRKN